MGDRANIIIKQTPANVYLYGHWMGQEAGLFLRDALAKRQRWNDECYLARIIFARMTKGHEEAETGFGIATAECDRDYSNCNLVVDCGERRVSRSDGARSWSFDEFSSLTDAAARSANQPTHLEE